MTYELWDMESMNMVFDWNTATEAEASVREVVSRKRVAVLGGHVLLTVDDDENSTLIAEGEAMLVAIKRLAAAERENASHTTSSDRRAG